MLVRQRKRVRAYHKLFAMTPAAKPLPPAQPAWPALIAVLAVGGLYLALPPSLTIGPSWLLLAVVSVLMVPVVVARLRGSFVLNQVLGYIVLVIVTAVSALVSLHAGPLAALPPDCARESAAVGDRALGHQYPGVRVVVLASGWRRTACAPYPRQPHRGRFSLSPNDHGARSTEAVRSKPGLPGLWIIFFWRLIPVRPSRLPIHRYFPAWAKVAMMVQSSDLLRHGGVARRARGKHSLIRKSAFGLTSDEPIPGLDGSS